MIKQKTKIVLSIILLLLIVSVLGVLWKTNILNKNEDNIKQNVSNSISPNKTIDEALLSIETSSNNDINKSIKLIKVGDFKKSISKIEKILKTNLTKNEKLGLELLLAHSYLSYGSVYYNESENAQKARNILDSSKINKKSWYYNYNIGYSYEIENNFQKALFYYKQANKISDDNIKKAKTINQIGHVYDLKGNFNMAFSYYQQAYKKNPSDIQINLNMGRSFVRKKELVKAKKYLEKIIDNVQDKFTKSEIYFNLSTIYLYIKGDKISNYQKSITLAQEGINTNTKYPHNYLGVSRILILLEINLNEAEKYLNNAIELYPKFSDAYKWLGILKQTQGKYKESIVHFKDAIKYSDEDITIMDNSRLSKKGEIYYSISISYIYLKEKEIAYKYIKKSMESLSTISAGLLQREIRKENYGIFSILKGDKKFNSLINGLK